MSEEVIGGYGSANEVGHSGSETSERAAGKVTGARSIQVFGVVGDQESFGITCEELENHLKIGHGAASGALTRLHRGGWISRLVEERDGQQVYVIPDCVEGRDESPYRPNVAYREGYKTPMPLEPSVTEVEVRVEVPVKPEWEDQQILAAMSVAGIHELNLDRMKVLIANLP